MTKDWLKKFQSKDIGIAGIHCPCCFDKPHKKEVFRAGRRRLKAYTKKEIEKYLYEK